MSTLHIVTLCTGNAARSVMAGVMLEQLAEMEGFSLTVTTAGTHVLEGQPLGMRTKEAMISIGELDLWRREASQPSACGRGLRCR